MEILWEKIPFWKNQKKTPDYKFQNRDEVTWIEITSGSYAGVIYSYGKVRLNSEIGFPKLEFSYNIIHSGEHDLHDLQDDQEFVIVMGDILTEIIIEYESTREVHTEEPDLQ